MPFLILSENETEKIRSDISEVKEQLQKISNLKLKQEQWISTEEAMKILKVSRRQLQKLRDNGILKFSKVVGKIYFKYTDIIDMLENNYNGIK
jgi:hypothetical protein